MAAVAGTERADQAAVPPGTARRRRSRPPAWRWIILVIAGAYFLIPLYAALRFAGFKAFPSVLHQSGFTGALALSVRLAVITTVITLVLMVPTTVYVHLRLPRLRRLLEAVTILPIVIPPVVLIVGVLQISPGSLKSSANLLALEYVVLAMPFAYRSIDAGLQALDLRTLVDASNSLGAGWPSTLWRVLTIALVLGEYTMASLDLYQTFPVWIVNFEQTSGPVSVASSLLALFVTWLFLMVIATLGSRRAARTGGSQATLFSVVRRDTGGTR